MISNLFLCSYVRIKTLATFEAVLCLAIAVAFSSSLKNSLSLPSPLSLSLLLSLSSQMKADLLSRKGDYNQAAQYFQELLGRKPGQPGANFSPALPPPLPSPHPSPPLPSPPLPSPPLPSPPLPLSRAGGERVKERKDGVHPLTLPSLAFCHPSTSSSSPPPHTHTLTLIDILLLFSQITSRPCPG